MTAARYRRPTYRDARGRVRTRARPTQRELLGELLAGWFGGVGRGPGPDLGRFGHDAPLGRRLLWLGGALALCGIALAINLTLRGTHETVPAVVPFEVTSRLLYAAPGATVNDFTVYDPDAEGDAPAITLDAAVSVPLAHFVELTSNRVIRSEALQGVQTLTVELAHPDGTLEEIARRRVRIEELEPPLDLEFDGSAVVDAIARFEQTRGPGEHSVLVTATADVNATVLGSALQTQLLHGLEFVVDGETLRLQTERSLPVQRFAGEVAGEGRVARRGTVPLLGDMTFARLRAIAVGGAVLGAIALELVLLATVFERGRGELRRVRRRYGSLLANVATLPELAADPIDVRSIEQLATVARRARRPLIEVATDGATEYLVVDWVVMYRYRLAR